MCSSVTIFSVQQRYNDMSRLWKIDNERAISTLKRVAHSVVVLFEEGAGALKFIKIILLSSNGVKGKSEAVKVKMNLILSFRRLRLLQG